MTEKNLQKQMQQEMNDKLIFNQAKSYAFEYAEKVSERNVYPSEAALENLVVFDEPMPQSRGNASSILEMLHQYGSPATVAQTGGRYFGLVNGGVVPAALAVKWLNDFWDQNTPLYVTSPITSKLETVAENWLKQMFNLPETTVAGFVSGTSLAIVAGLAAARYRIYQNLNWDFNAKGFRDSPAIRIVAGKHAHSAVLKAIALLGFGKDTVEWVEVDTQGRLLADKLPELDESTILILQAGNVNSGAFDDFDAICEIANKAKAWIHIDGAFGLWAAGSNQLKHLTSGIEKADSWSVDGHKTLNTPYDCGIVLCKDKDALVSALQASGSYIVYGDNRDGMLYTPEMSRRARAIELWATMKYLGKEGINEMVNGMHERAKQFAAGLSSNGFRILNEVVFNQVLVACDSDDETEQTLKNLQDLRTCWCGGSLWFDEKVIRISVCSWATTEEDVRLSIASFVEARNQINK